MTSVPLTDLARLHEPLRSDLREAFDRVLGASSFILGAEVEDFESAFAEVCGTRHCVGVASGTAALTIMLQAAGIKSGDEVLVPAHTFVASALAVVHAGARPVCVEVEQRNGLIDPEAARSAIGPRTAAILAVHLYGQACAMDALSELASSHGLALLEDAAQAHGATYAGEPVGSLGTAAAFSFYPSKNLGALGDGGAICTNDHQLAARARRLRDLGRDDDSVHSLSGYNERLDGVQAALLGVKLPYLHDWTAARRAVAASYERRLTGRVEFLGETPESPCTYHLFPIRVSDRDGLAAFLSDRGVASGVHYPVVLPDQPALADVGLGDAPPIAKDWANRELSIPIFPGMNEVELDRVVSAVGAWDGGVGTGRS